jgi:hypothetical protein
LQRVTSASTTGGTDERLDGVAAELPVMVLIAVLALLDPMEGVVIGTRGAR